MEKQNLIKGHAYFVTLQTGEVYQARYMGYHEESCCYWFQPLPYALATNGPQWVYIRQLRAIFDLGEPRNGGEFAEAVEKMLD